MQSRSIVLSLAGITAILGANMWTLNWTDRQAMPTPVAGGIVAQLDGQLAYAGGTTWKDGVKLWLRDVVLFDPAKNQWTPGPSLPQALAYGAALRLEDGLEVLGGSDGQTTSLESWRLSKADGTWQSTGSAPAGTLFGRAEAIGQRAYLFGGCADVADLTQCTDTVYVRDTNSQWKQISSLPQGAVAMPAATKAGGRVYLFGGCSMKTAGALVNRDDAYAFEAGTRKWTRLKPLPKANRGMTALLLDDRHILLAGGYTATLAEAAGKPGDFGFAAEVWIYDIQTDSYTAATPLPFAAAGVELLAHSQTVYALGGEQRMKGRSNRLLAAPFAH